MQQRTPASSPSMLPALTRGGFVFALLAVLALGVAPLFAAEPTAQLGAASGTVAVVRANGSAIQPAGSGTSLGPGDRIATVGKSSATIDLPGLGQIELGADTAIVVHQLRTEGTVTVVALEIVNGMTVHRLSPFGGAPLEYRVTDPSGQAVARATGSAVFGVGRDENGNVTVACANCANGVLTFPGDGGRLGSNQARTLTGRGGIVDDGFRGSIYDALAEGASAEEDGSDTPSGNRLPPGQRTGSRDERRDRDDEDDDVSNSPAAAARILSPRNGETIVGSTLTVLWEAPGYNIVPAAQASRPDEVHAHIFLDRDPTPLLGTGRPIPLGDPSIVHTANPVVTFQNVTSGSHRVWLVLAFGNHVPLDPPVVDTVTFTVASSAATVTPTATVAPTATPGGTIQQEATIANFVYLPDPIQIRVGQTVRWTNLDDVPDGHTVTASDRSWTSPVLDQGDTFVRTFTQAGNFMYFCEPHPQMTAFIEVQP